MQREELVATDGELVQRRRRVLVAPGRDHLREVLERAAAADRELGRELRDLLRHRREHVGDPVAQRASVALRDRIGVHELGGEPRDAERDARRPLQAARVADHDLEAAAAEVEAHRGRGIEHHRGADGAEDQARLLETADDVDDDPGLLLDAVDELAAVRGAADRARRARRWISSAPAASASRRKRRMVATAWSAAVGGMEPWRLTTSPRRSISFSCTSGSRWPSAWTSATSRWNEFVPRSMAATRTGQG